MSNDEIIEKIAPNSLDEEGKLKSWETQLLDYEYNIRNAREPLVINNNSKKLLFSGIDDKPILINTSTIEKIKKVHNLDLKFLINLKGLINNPLFAIDSIQHSDSKLYVTNKKNKEGLPIIFVIRKDKNIAETYKVNEIASVYDKKNLQNLINKTIEDGGKIYLNPTKTKELEEMGFNFEEKIKKIEKKENENSWSKKLKNDKSKGLER
ncbi:hypothetical protein [Fusobacterium polymorphum]|jgi:hypothetical protein|uniref:MuF-C-terminal domain-containing protein n=1 Tax=Fusobacterium nucleatum subsp. polymorphum TaxID=76857 RepID=UPI003252B9AE